MMSTASDDFFPVGTVVGIHGLRGDLKVRPLSGEATVLTEVGKILLGTSPSTATQYRVTRAGRHKGNILLHLEQVDYATAAQALIGREVFVTRDDLAPLTDNEFYWYELEGMRVIDCSRGELGALAEIFTTAAHDIYVVRGAYGEILIPAVDAIVLQIDVASKTMQVDLPEGLLTEDVGHEV